MNHERLRMTLVPLLGDNLPAPEPELRFLCPRCITKKKKADTSGHLHVSSEKEKFVCFRCGWKGPLSALLSFLNAEVGATITDWGSVVRGMRIFQSDKVVEDEAYDNTLEIEYPCDVVHPLASIDAWNYLTTPKEDGGRGLTQQQIDYYRIAAGTGKYATRIFVPTLHDGNVVFWVARSIIGAEPKYLNPRDVSKKHYVFGLEQAKACDWVIITEGVFSAIAAGFNAVATFGKAVSVEQRSLLMDAKFQRYYVALDGDARKEAIELSRWFQSRGCNVYLVNMRDGDDPDSDTQFQLRVQQAKPFDFYSAASFDLCGK